MISSQDRWKVRQRIVFVVLRSCCLVFVDDDRRNSCCLSFSISFYCSNFSKLPIECLITIIYDIIAFAIYSLGALISLCSFWTFPTIIQVLSSPSSNVSIQKSWEKFTLHLSTTSVHLLILFGKIKCIWTQFKSYPEIQ